MADTSFKLYVEFKIILILLYLTLSWCRSLSYRNQSIDLSANQWTGFYITGASVMKVIPFYSATQIEMIRKICQNMLTNFNHSLVIIISEIKAKTVSGTFLN